MSGSDTFSDAVEWFVNLSETEKGRVFETLDSGEELLSEEGVAHLRVLVTQIQNELSERDEEAAVDVLTEAGISSARAQLLTEKVIEQAPPTDVIIDDLNALTDDEFSMVVESSIAQYVQTIGSEVYDIDADSTTVELLMRPIQDSFMDYLRGQGTQEQFVQRFIDLGLAEPRAEKIIAVYKEYEDIAFKRLVFRNVQDTLLKDMRDLKDQQRETQQLLDQVLHILESAARESDT